MARGCTITYVYYLEGVRGKGKPGSSGSPGACMSPQEGEGEEGPA